MRAKIKRGSCRGRLGGLFMPVAGAWLLAFLLHGGDAFAVPYDPDWGSIGVFTDAATCAQCHRASSDVDPGVPALMRNPLTDTGQDVSPDYQWRHSVMAHSFSDPYYRAVVEDEVSVFPGMQGLIEDTCLRCHTPMAHEHAHQSNTSLTQDASCGLADGCYRFSTALQQDHAKEGISCTLCHQVKADNLGTAASFSGQFSIASVGDVDAFRIYGPYQNPHNGGATAMFNNSGYTPAFGSHVTTSGHCASCHTLFTPTMDVDTGLPSGTQFLEQGPYLEWQNSVYVTGAAKAQQCQDCHMPEPVQGTYQTRIATRPDGTVNSQWPVRSPFYTHSMVGGNSYLLELLRDNRVSLEIGNTTTTAGFDEKISETRAFLSSSAAVIDITRAETSGNDALVDVRITNKTGHKLPTGYPSRRMWLHLVVRDSMGQVVFESGAPDAQGEISTDTTRLASDCLARVKPPGFVNGSCFEPHLDLVTLPSQVPVYETVLGDTNGHITHVLLHAGSYLKDNRIPPEGFTTSRADTIETQTRSVGVAADADFNNENGTEGSGSDTVHYQVALNDPADSHTITARLLFQSIQPSFIDGLLATGSQVTGFKQMAALLPPTVEELSVANANVSPAGTGAVAAGGGGCTLVPRGGPVDYTLALLLLVLGGRVLGRFLSV